MKEKKEPLREKSTEQRRTRAKQSEGESGKQKWERYFVVDLFCFADILCFKSFEWKEAHDITVKDNQKYDRLTKYSPDTQWSAYKREHKLNG